MVKIEKDILRELYSEDYDYTHKIVDMVRMAREAESEFDAVEAVTKRFAGTNIYVNTLETILKPAIESEIIGDIYEHQSVDFVARNWNMSRRNIHSILTNHGIKTKGGVLDVDASCKI